MIGWTDGLAVQTIKLHGCVQLQEAFLQMFDYEYNPSTVTSPKGCQLEIVLSQQLVLSLFLVRSLLILKIPLFDVRVKLDPQ